MFDSVSSDDMGLCDADAAALFAFAEGTLALRQWERNCVPFCSPQIALDIALYATAAKLRNHFIVSKSVHLTVGYSADRVREVVADLVSGGWILKTQHPSDKRVRVLEATDKLMRLMSEYEKRIRLRLSQSNRGPAVQPQGQQLHFQAG